eukprot:scaffold33512_cov113-Skeletonema_dohrnii-CCMP3373.AAC.5
MSTSSSSDAGVASVGADTNNPSTGNDEPRPGTTPTPAAGHKPQDQHQHATATGDEDSPAGTAAEDGTSDASAGTSGKTQDPGPVDTPVDKVIRLLGFRQNTLNYLRNNYPKQQQFEELLQLPSEEIRAIKKEDGGETNEKEKGKARFNQNDRAKLILLGRWTENNLADDHDGKGKDIEWEIFNKKSFNGYVRDVDAAILKEILKELHLDGKFKDKKFLKDNGVHTPASFVDKSKYWYEHEMTLSSTDVNEIERFKQWYKYQLDTHLPLDWIASFRMDSTKEKKIEWRKVLKAIGMDDDAIQALEINGICDFVTLIHKSQKWRIAEPTSKKNWGDVSNTNYWNEWESLGLKEKDARNIINFRHWHKFYVAGKKDRSGWATEFQSKQYNNFVQRLVDPIKLEMPCWWKSWWKRGWWVSKFDSPKLDKEKHDYYNILHRAVEDGSLTEEQRYHLRQHYKGRREKMNLIQEIHDGAGDASFQEKRLTEICEEEAKKDKTRKSDYLEFMSTYFQFVFSALIVYALLFFWVGTTFVLMLTHPISDGEEDTDTYLVFVHNITFGLVTAVVIQELGEEKKKTSLYSRFLPVYNERLLRFKETRFRMYLKLRRTNHSMVNVCEKISAAAVSIGYSYFGLNGKNAPNLQEAKDTVDMKVKDAVQSAIGGGDGGSGGEEAKFTNDKGVTTVIKSRHELDEESKRYRELRKKAAEDGNLEDVDDYHKCIVQLQKLAPMLPSEEELKNQLNEAQEKVRTAVNDNDDDFGGALIRLSKEVVELKRKLKGEKDAKTAGGHTSSDNKAEQEGEDNAEEV